MSAQSKSIIINTRSHSDLILITDIVSETIRSLNLINGLVHIFVNHTTCGLTINENADPAVTHDLLYRLEELAPWDDPRDRHMEGNSAAHLKSTILGSSVSIPVIDGRMRLGTWQGIYLGEFDGPRPRTIIVTSLSAS